MAGTSAMPDHRPSLFVRWVRAPLHWQIAQALLLAFFAATLVRASGSADAPWAHALVSAAAFVGDLFLRALSMMVVPLVVCSVVTGSLQLGQGKRLLAVGGKTIAFYAVTCALAVGLALLLMNVIAPGRIDAASAARILGEVPAAAVQVNHGASDIAAVVLRLFPPNIFAAAADNTQLLGIIAFSILLGIFIHRLPPRHAERQRELWEGFNLLFQKITEFILRFLPLGVLGLVFPVCVRAGWTVLMPVLWFMLTVMLALFVHAAVVLSLILRAGGIPPFKHLRAMMPAIFTAFSTSSSVATVPVTLECVEQAGVPKDIAGFSIPLGATVNMNGTALYECAAVLFIAQIYASAGAAPLSVGAQLLVVLLALLTSVGVAGIPSASLVAIVVIAGAVGLPLEAVGLIWVTDRVLDMLRTSVNVYGDTCAAVWVAKSEGSGVYGENKSPQGVDAAE